MNKKDFISVAKVLGFHGVNGELRVGYTKGHEAHLAEVKTFFLISDDVVTEYPVTSIRFHKKYMLVKLKSLNSINDVQDFQNCFLYVKKNFFDKLLDTDEFLVDDLIGMRAFNKNDELIGIVKNVDSNGATDILSVQNEGKTFLIPFVKDLVPEIDIKGKKVLINDIEGLLE